MSTRPDGPKPRRAPWHGRPGTAHVRSDVMTATAPLPNTSTSASLLPAAPTTVTVTSTQAPAPATSYPPVNTSPAIVIAAVIAAVVAIASLTVTLVIGIRTSSAAKRSATAAERSATAATEGASAATRGATAATTSAEAAKASADAATRNASASERSSQASVRSAGAAVEAVRVNRETATGAATRAQADAIAKRYQDAASQLGHEQAPVRLAGAYAMARLADDWPEQRQECVDVLCAYLRMDWKSVDRFDENEPPEPPETEVRRAVVDLIATHVRKDAPTSWSSLDFNLRSAKLPHLRLDEARFDKQLVLSDAEILEPVYIRQTMFVGGATFRRTHFVCGMQMLAIETYQPINFDECIVPIWSQANLIVRYIDRPAAISFSGHSAGRFQVILQASREPQGPIVLKPLYGSTSEQGHPMRISAHPLNSERGAKQEYPAVNRHPQPAEYAQVVEISDELKIVES